MSNSSRNDVVEENFVREPKTVIDQEAARAVEEQNKREKTSLKFKKVISSRQQEIPRILSITLEAESSGEPNNYEVKLVKRGANYILDSFKILVKGPGSQSGR
ncbi:Cysteine proteinase inhibitor [Quillaja saponaria]|uniref:Cysteine proteinase inhibitor n=1 Tax=Quillaja saponaria TaxID=32244 RepID=A0AAD7LXL5_QUISA|nr:Cysteine proteinase inhibitor [Quillaja saponaria]